MTDVINVDEVKKTLLEFAKIREWEKFHAPKNLAAAISVESAELLEIFQWLTEQESWAVKDNEAIKEKIRHELADIILYSLRMADLFEINLSAALSDKIKINNSKYPADQVKGSAKKYTEYKLQSKETGIADN